MWRLSVASDSGELMFSVGINWKKIFVIGPLLQVPVLIPQAQTHGGSISHTLEEAYQLQPCYSTWLFRSFFLIFKTFWEKNTGFSVFCFIINHFCNGINRFDELASEMGFRRRNISATVSWGLTTWVQCWYRTTSTPREWPSLCCPRYWMSTKFTLHPPPPQFLRTLSGSTTSFSRLIPFSSFSLAPEPQLRGHSALRVARCVGACNNHIMWFGYTRYCCVRYGLQFYTSRSIERIGFCREEFWKNLTQRQRKVHFF